MSSEAEYKQRISTYNLLDLLEWQQIQTGKTPGWDAGKALEYLVIRAFEVEGVPVTYPYTVFVGGTVVEQIDGAVYTDGLSCLVECKDQIGNRRDRSGRKTPAF